MKRIQHLMTLTLAVVMTLFSGSTYAQDALLDELMNKSGITKQLEGFPELLQMGFRSATQGAEPEKQAGLNQMMEKMNRAYNIDDFKATLRKVVGEGLNESDMTEVLTWLNSPLGQKITQIEEKNSTVESEQAKQAFMMTFDSTTVPPERIKMIQDLDEAVMATDMLLTVILNSQKAIMLAVMPYVPAEQRIPLKDIDTQIEINRPVLKSQYRDYVLGSMFYVYQELSDDELKGYIEFARSQIGAKYHKTVSNAFGQAFTQAATSLGADLKDMVPKETPAEEENALPKE